MENNYIKDLLEENRINFAKSYQLNNVRKTEINNLFRCIDLCADASLLSEEEYLNACSSLFKVLFRVVGLTREKKDLLQDIKDNLDMIERIRKNGTIEETNKKRNY